jgi:hypothetical protein
MNSFIGISKLHTTNLAVVTPGIAEALLATAYGLAAAIPAIYNSFARGIASYRALYGDASVEILNLTSRHLNYTRIAEDRPMRAAAPCERSARPWGGCAQRRPRDQRHVVLVLLIIFMIAAPLATVDVHGRPSDLERGTSAATSTADLSDGQI